MFIRIKHTSTKVTDPTISMKSMNAVSKLLLYFPAGVVGADFVSSASSTPKATSTTTPLPYAHSQFVQINPEKGSNQPTDDDSTCKEEKDPSSVIDQKKCKSKTEETSNGKIEKTGTGKNNACPNFENDSGVTPLPVEHNAPLGEALLKNSKTEFLIDKYGNLKQSDGDFEEMIRRIKDIKKCGYPFCKKLKKKVMPEKYRNEKDKPKKKTHCCHHLIPNWKVEEIAKSAGRAGVE
ncbi:DgyrCDS14439 [Dimorphilus gyrociliatus]|uniref:DgyrCDS14439 n=1 Tax=Dimorphilus gyrociliatus TaxID=2664684 RepID=A0A7I8WDM2_9ANNE|nr:DgyrCDS14439 [Dimorphilus gyrociliatus]